MRAIGLLATGAFVIYVGVGHLNGDYMIGGIGAILLGLALVYAGVVML